MPHPAFILWTLPHEDKLDPLVFRLPGPLPPGFQNSLYHFPNFITLPPPHTQILFPQ